MTDSIEIKYIKLDDLIPDERNPKTHNVDAIMESIKRFGFISPIIRNDHNDTLLAGHGRLKALKKLYKDGNEIPKNIKAEEDTWYVPTIDGVSIEDEQDQMAYIIADNRIVQLGSWNTPQLVEAIEVIAEATGTLDGVGFAELDIDKIYEAIDGPIEVEDDFEEEEKEVNLYVDIQFEEEYQLDLWYEFIDMIKGQYPGETIAERFDNYIKEYLNAND